MRSGDGAAGEEGLRFGVWGLGFGVGGLKFEAWGLEFDVKKYCTDGYDYKI
jgi:hypothetical protein